MTLAYVWKKKFEKETGKYTCTLKCGKLQLCVVCLSPVADGKKQKFNVNVSEFLFSDSKLESLSGRTFKSVEDVQAAVQKVFDAKLSKLEAA